MKEEDLTQFKENILRGYVYPYMDRLLDLANIIKKAKNYDDISTALAKEKGALKVICERENGSNQENSKKV